MDAILLEIKNKKVRLGQLHEARAIDARNIIEIQKHITELQIDIEENNYGQLGWLASLFWLSIGILGALWIRFCFLALGTGNNADYIMTAIFCLPGILVVWFVIYVMRDATSSRNQDKSNLLDLEKKINVLSESQDTTKKEKNFNLLKREIESLEKKYFEELVTHFTKIYDHNKNGKLDILENSDDFLKLLQENQDKILNISEKMGVEYIDPLVKIDEKLKLKKESLNLTLKKILEPKKNYDDKANIEIFEKFLKEEIQTYNVILTNSLFMASSLIANDRITFRRIYEKFDKLDMFNSNYENQTIELLSNVNENLVQLLTSIDNLNESISQSIADLSYVTEENSNELSIQLKKVNSSIDLNTLITGIGAYQNYKTNKNTKHLIS